MHRDRKRKPARRVPFRQPKPTILILCEGAITEPQYLNGFRIACHNPRVDIEIADDHGCPKTLVETAKRLKNRAIIRAKRERDENLEYNHVWCVFDVDEHPYIPDAKQMALDSSIRLAISNPCFELWLLLHFRENPGMQNRHRICQLLRDHTPDYHKHVEYGEYASGYEQAVRRATQLCKQAIEDQDVGRNPSTNVYELTECIIHGDTEEIC